MQGHQGTGAEEVKEYHVPKDKWGPGPWQQEPDREEWRDTDTGLPCLIVRAPTTGSLCGYVGVPPGHPWHGVDYSGADASVHGGLTYSDRCAGHICHVPAPGEPDDVWWLGFDTAHFMDYMPARAAMMRDLDVGMPQYMRSAYRDMAYVRAEVARLASQVAAAA